MTPKESGRKGGLATRDNHISLCPCCGNPIESQYYSETGRRGGETAAQRAGKDGSLSMSERGQLGGRGNKRNGRGGDDSLSAGRISN